MGSRNQAFKIWYDCGWKMVIPPLQGADTVQQASHAKCQCLNVVVPALTVPASAAPVLQSRERARSPQLGHETS